MAHDSHAEHYHPSWKEYKWVALILTIITIVEVWAYYIPSFVASAAFVPALLIMSAVKFAIVVMFYMHLKYDHKLFRALFTGPLIIAIATLMALLAVMSAL
ncbi:MAG: cytochrome C oxidase subunit IV family protein [Gemmatimonadetes bacterium]|nr:cytochrome C oxidase subunit IV family protein [Gemmatimonadota bacterium]